MAAERHPPPDPVLRDDALDAPFEGAGHSAFQAAIVESFDGAIVGKTLDGIIRSWNPGAARLFGYSADEIVGRPVRVLIPEDRQQEEDEILARLRRGERIEHLETVRRHRDGTLLDVSLTISPIRDDEGRVVGASKVLIDVTDRKRAEAALRDSEERFRTLADNVAQFAWMADGRGSIVWYNRRWFEYTGTTLEQMQGWGWQAVQHPDHVDRVVARFRDCVERGVPWEDTFPLRGADGEYRWFLSRAIPIRDPASGEVTRWFGTNTDITERMAMEAQLREADRRKDEFLATLAHELRNPLAPIRHGLELLRRGGVAGEATDRVYDTLERQTDHLVRLVDDLLDVSRITRGKVELRRSRIELAAVVDRAVEVSRPLLDEAGLELVVELPDDPVWLAADPTRLAQVLSNLLNNAANYTPEGGRVTLSAAAGPSEVAVTVADTGAGIPRERLRAIFDLFVQGGGGSGGHGGLGIGLTLVKSLVELHGGRVEARSEGAGRGSELIVTLPRVAAPRAETDAGAPAAGPPAVRETPADRAPAARPLRILVVDDNRDAADSLTDLLELFGHEAHAAFDGAAAVAAAERLRPDVVLLDLGMPVMDGFETARHLRGLPGGGDVVLIALTGWGQDQDRRRTREAGFDHHLVKPTDIQQLQRLLGESAARRDDAARR
jgi:PAS domain S-box-containing protein